MSCSKIELEKWPIEPEPIEENSPLASEFKFALFPSSPLGLRSGVGNENAAQVEVNQKNILKLEALPFKNSRREAELFEQLQNLQHEYDKLEAKNQRLEKAISHYSKLLKDTMPKKSYDKLEKEHKKICLDYANLKSKSDLQWQMLHNKAENFRQNYVQLEPKVQELKAANEQLTQQLHEKEQSLEKVEEREKYHLLQLAELQNQMREDKDQADILRNERNIYKNEVLNLNKGIEKLNNKLAEILELKQIISEQSSKIRQLEGLNENLTARLAANKSASSSEQVIKQPAPKSNLNKTIEYLSDIEHRLDSFSQRLTNQAQNSEKIQNQLYEKAKQMDGFFAIINNQGKQ